MAILSAAVTAGAGLLDTVIGFSFAPPRRPGEQLPERDPRRSSTRSSPSWCSCSRAATTSCSRASRPATRRCRHRVSRHGEPLGARRRGFGQLWLIGLEIVAPALVALLITDAALGLVSRAVPQMNVFVVGLPAKILVGFTVIAASLPFSELAPRGRACSSRWPRPSAPSGGDELVADNRTEKPTPKRREEARKKGQMARSIGPQLGHGAARAASARSRSSRPACSTR